MQISRSIIHIIKKTLDDFWSTFDALFNGFNGITLILMASLIFAKKHENFTKKSVFCTFLGQNFKIWKKLFYGLESTFQELSYDVLHSYCIFIVSRVIEKKHPNFFDIKSLISRTLYHGLISKFDTSQFTKFANFYCL